MQLVNLTGFIAPMIAEYRGCCWGMLAGEGHDVPVGRHTSLALVTIHISVLSSSGTKHVYICFTSLN